jgi:hypothetical protein
MTNLDNLVKLQSTGGNIAWMELNWRSKVTKFVRLARESGTVPVIEFLFK